MEKVESFKLDHNKVKAPYVRKCCVLEGKMGDKVSKFDLRFLQPNIEAFGTAAIHGLEHLLATYLREELEDIIDLSPMGCRTGFYLIMWGDVDPSLVKLGLEKALQKVIDCNDMVAASAVECGNYRDLSLFGAQEYAKKALEEEFSLNIYGK
ncbi:MAG TPA: S-ribosylhomocysteine lyase [Terrisporobacter glycolicus]|uniref:S-ribosylhomocysteine lyase n=1 Tax=Terrisporobacter petrolearius TaxID=1460447 RepID=A0ABZ3FI42_9FIRM|nr:MULTISPECIES: S-ribosylhomocysteine lyase [Terrisporobacter]MBN9648826.1 S-ribosylhomocysteine lyase [Terrisporobacter glycolicus]HBI94041.1 S-ribosylhomocysteine lyase [Terrisporobacter hibernicus]